MNRYEREELAELHLRVVHTAVQDALSAQAPVRDMGAWIDNERAAKEARAAFWEALYGLPCDNVSSHGRQAPKKAQPLSP